MAFPLRDLVESTTRFVLRNPGTMVRMAQHAAGLRVAVPLDALRWLASELLRGDDAPSDVVITARPPALSVGATTELMRNRIRVSASVEVRDVRVGPGELTAVFRVSNLDIKAFDPKSNFAKLLKSGALHLEKPGGLVKMMGGAPPALVSHTDDEFTVDFLRVPAIADNALVQRLLAAITPVLTVQDIRTEDDMLLLGLAAHPTRVVEAVRAAVGM